MTTPTRTPERSVPPRRMAFEASLADVPRHFAAGGDILHSHIAACLSAVFPDGEDFFVRSVRAFRDQVQDPELRRQVAGFIGQESIHERQHRGFNDRLAELGYPVRGIERFTRWNLETRERVAPPIANLALTAALEHFTATLAEMLLADERARDLFGDERVLDLFLWHALEEAEHKAVAFDVYRAVGGTERMRVTTMKVLRYGFVVYMALLLAVSIARDPVARRHPRRLWQSLKRFRRSPLASRKLWDQLGEYNRPGFHPDDRDTTELLARWREELFGESGRLNDRLLGVGTAA